MQQTQDGGLGGGTGRLPIGGSSTLNIASAVADSVAVGPWTIHVVASTSTLAGTVALQRFAVGTRTGDA